MLELAGASVWCFCPLVATGCISLMLPKRLCIIYIGSYTPKTCITVYDQSLYPNKINVFTKKLLLKVYFSIAVGISPIYNASN